jgi:hypothetical protein
MGPLIVLLGFMVFTVILWIIIAETDRKSKTKNLIFMIIAAVILLVVVFAMSEVFAFLAFLESCNNCVTEVGRMG